MSLDKELVPDCESKEIGEVMPDVQRRKRKAAITRAGGLIGSASKRKKSVPTTCLIAHSSVTETYKFVFNICCTMWSPCRISDAKITIAKEKKLAKIAKAKGKSTKKVNTKRAETKSNNVAYHVDTTPVIVDVETMSLSSAFTCQSSRWSASSSQSSMSDDSTIVSLSSDASTVFTMNDVEFLCLPDEPDGDTAV